MSLKAEVADRMAEGYTYTCSLQQLFCLAYSDQVLN